MRILIDLQGAQSESRFRGIGRYSLSLAQAISRHPRGHEISLLLNSRLSDSVASIRQALAGLVPPERIHLFDFVGPVRQSTSSNLSRARVAQALREGVIARLAPDAVLCTSHFEGFLDEAVTSVQSLPGAVAPLQAVVLYDLIPLKSPAAYLPTEQHRQFYESKIQQLRWAHLLLAISESTRTEALDALNIDPECVTTVYAGVGDVFSNNRAYAPAGTAVQHCGIRRDFVLFAPGGFDPRKNVERLIEAYAGLPADLRLRHQLVVVSRLGGGEREFIDRVRRRASLAGDELVLTGYVSDADLTALYRAASVFVFPSLHEGFGLPVLEAMACGTAVIGSNVTGIPEVIARHDALFDPHSVKSIRDTLVRVLSDSEFREELRSYGRQRARSFSWERTADLTLQALEQRLTCGTVSRAARGEADIVAAVAAIVREERKERTIDLVAVADCMAFNEGRGATRQLLLDITVIQETDAKSGIQRVVRGVLQELMLRPPASVDVRPMYFDGARYRYASSFVARVLGDGDATEDEVVDLRQGDIYLALDLTAHLTGALRPIHGEMRRRGVALYFVVYDILLVQRPEWWPAGTAQMFEEWLRCVVELGDGLLCISDAVATEVRNWVSERMPEWSTRIEVGSFHLGSDVENSVPSRGMPTGAGDVLERLSQGTSFLMVGTIEPRKGHAQALAAFESMWGRGASFNLVIVGNQGWLVDELVERIRRHPMLGARLFWLEGVSDEYLDAIYARANCLLCPSEGEGFGLPLIEAALHGVPILARRLPVFVEVAGEYASYFDGREPEDLADAIQRWVDESKQGLVTPSVGMPTLTWRESADQLLAAMGLCRLPGAGKEG